MKAHQLVLQRQLPTTDTVYKPSTNIPHTITGAGGHQSRAGGAKKKQLVVQRPHTLHSSHPFQSFLAFFNRSWWPPRLSWRSSRRSSWWCSASCARRAWAGALRRQTRAATAWLRRSEAPAGEGGGWRKQGQPGRCGGMQLHLTAGGGGGQWWRRRQASVAWVECHLRRLALKAMYCCVASFEHPLLCTATSATP